MDAFTPDRAADLGGPEFLRALRSDAARRLAGEDLPTAEAEDWRYGPIGDLDLARYDPATVRPDGPVTLPEDAARLVEAVGGRGALVVLRNGWLASADVDADAGVTVRAATDGVMFLDRPERDAIDDLHDAFVPEVVIIDVVATATAPAPIVVVSMLDPGHPAAFPHIVVRTATGAEVTVLHHQPASDGPAFSAPVVELQAAAGSNLRYIDIQTTGAEVWQTGRLLARAERDATVRAWLAALGGHYARTYVSAELPDQGASVDITGVYFGDGDQTLDTRSLQDHSGPRSRSNFLLKGAVVEQAHGIYTGLIRVREGAKRTDSFLTNRNLVLGEGAGVDSVPNLEIVNENDLASCGHAAATGPVDEEHLFYLESRGIPRPVAERLIVFGFFDDVIASIPIAAVHPMLRAVIAGKLGRADG